VTGANEDGAEEPEPECGAEASTEEEEPCEAEVRGDDPRDSCSGTADEVVRADDAGANEDWEGVEDRVAGVCLGMVGMGTLPRMALSLCFDIVIERAGLTFSCSSSANS